MKLKLKEKVATAEAVQFDGSQESAFEVAEFIGDCRMIERDYFDGEPQLKIGFYRYDALKCVDRPTSINVGRGQYVVRVPDEPLAVMTKADFNAKWQVDNRPSMTEDVLELARKAHEDLLRPNYGFGLDFGHPRVEEHPCMFWLGNKS